MTSIPGRGNVSKRPDGRRAGELTAFTKGAADRIAKVVRTVELGDRSAQGLRFGRAAEAASTGKIFRICTFTGAWSINSAKTVTFKYQTTTPNTVSVTNLFFPIVGTTARDCAIAKEGTSWFLIDVPLFTASAFFAQLTASASYLSDIQISASLDTNDCTIAVQKTVTTVTITVLTSPFTSSFVRLEQ